MNKLHIAAGACFLIAVFMYTVGMEIAFGIGAIGILFEIFAWVLLLSTESKKED